MKPIALVLVAFVAACASAQWPILTCNADLQALGICNSIGQVGVLIAYWMPAEEVVCNGTMVAAGKCAPSEIGDTIPSVATRVIDALTLGSGWPSTVPCDAELVEAGACSQAQADAGASIPNPISPRLYAAEILGRQINGRTDAWERDQHERSQPKRELPSKANKASRPDRPGRPGRGGGENP